MNVGFTGTQIGMTENQKYHVAMLLLSLKGDEFHHGSCRGADTDAHRIAVCLGYEIIIHPPINPKKRSYFDIGEVLPEKEYLERNHDIVDATDVLIATPKTEREELRSGTWATVRYARKKGKVVHIIKPNEKMPPPIFKSDAEVLALLEDHDGNF